MAKKKLKIHKAEQRPDDLLLLKIEFNDRTIRTFVGGQLTGDSLDKALKYISDSIPEKHTLVPMLMIQPGVPLACQSAKRVTEILDEFKL